MVETKSIEVGTIFKEFSFILELGKVRELAAAIGDPNPDFYTGKRVPYTIATIIDLWGGQIPYGKLLELNLEKVLHGGHKYEYFKEISIGDEISVTTKVSDIQIKKSMTIYTVKREYKNQDKELLIIGYATIIEKSMEG